MMNQKGGNTDKIKDINIKLDKLLFENERNKELHDLSNLERMNLTILFSLLAIILLYFYHFQKIYF